MFQQQNYCTGSPKTPHCQYVRTFVTVWIIHIQGMDNEATSAWLQRIIGEGATDAQINGVRQILAGEQGISIISFHLAHLMILL